MTTTIKRNSARMVALLISALLALAVILITPAPAAEAQAAPSGMSYIVLPHPDDEWQQWALTETSPGNYQVFALMTQGEASGYCVANGGKGSQECKDKRLASWLGFLTDMSAADPSIPGDWLAPVTYQGVTAWVDAQGRGAAVAFDYGDGNLTEAEVVSAMRFITNPANRAVLGINATLPNYNMLGSYYNRSYKGCVTYAHADHYAVHRALFHHDLGVVYQAAATCKTDPDARRVQDVKGLSVAAAWTAQALFNRHYGWLGGYQLNKSVFQSTQAFWVRRF